MSISRRLFNIVRAQIGHYARRGGLGKGFHGDFKAEDNLADDYDFRASSSANKKHGSPDIVRYEHAYKLLEIPYGSSIDEIRTAHKKLLRKYHPDRFARDNDGLRDATLLSQEITAARDLLVDAVNKGLV